MNRPGLLGRYCVFSCGSTDLRSGHVVPANDTGLVEEPDAQARHRADPLAVLLDVREPLHSGALADHQDHMGLRDAPELRVGVDLIGDDDRETGNRDAVLYELDQRLVRAAGHLELDMAALDSWTD